MKKNTSDFAFFKKLVYIILIVVVQFSMYGDVYLTQSKLIWNTGLALDTQKRPNSFFELFPKISSYLALDEIQDGDVLWIQPTQIENFVLKYLHQLNKTIILLINTCDDTFPNCLKKKEYFDQLVNSKKIFHIFCQNCSISNHPKITQIPIGLDYHTLAYGKRLFGEPKISVEEQESLLMKTRNMSFFTSKALTACADFHFNDSMRFGNKQNKVFGFDRTTVFNTLKDLPYVYFFPKPMARRELWQKKIQFAFSLCPPGNGIDTHRLWEDMLLGLIPIVFTSPLDSLYKQFPVVIIKDWSEVTEENLAKWYAQYKDEIFSQETFQKLQQSHWLKKIRDKRELILRI